MKKTLKKIVLGAAVLASLASCSNEVEYSNKDIQLSNFEIPEVKIEKVEYVNERRYGGLATLKYDGDDNLVEVVNQYGDHGTKTTYRRNINDDGYAGLIVTDTDKNGNKTVDSRDVQYVEYDDDNYRAFEFIQRDENNDKKADYTRISYLPKGSKVRTSLYDNDGDGEFEKYVHHRNLRFPVRHPERTLYFFGLLGVAAAGYLAVDAYKKYQQRSKK